MKYNPTTNKVYCKKCHYLVPESNWLIKKGVRVGYRCDNCAGERKT